MNTLQKAMLEVESSRIWDALVRQEGNVHRAADVLGVPKSTLMTRLKRYHGTLLDKARELRGRKGNARGRPRIAGRTKRIVGSAWRKSGQSIAECARLLDLPESSVRDLLVRYDLPLKKKKKGSR